MVKKTYFDGVKDDQMFQNTHEAFTDAGFGQATHKLARQLSQKTKTFFYRLDHHSQVSISDMMVDRWFFLKKLLGLYKTKDLGVCHGDDVILLFHAGYGLLASKDPNDSKMVDFMVKLWTNFAIFHDPTPDDQSWPAYGTNDATYIRLKNSEITYTRDEIRDKNTMMWIDLFK